jgi:hypothetical protein
MSVLSVRKTYFLIIEHANAAVCRFYIDFERAIKVEIDDDIHAFYYNIMMLVK